MRYGYLVLLTIVTAFGGSVCTAHQDHVVTVAIDGTLNGIPAEYGPARLHVTFSLSPQAEISVSSLAINLGKNRAEVPRCIFSLINSRGLADIQASASWYHVEPRDLPYYLAVTFHDSRPIVRDLRPGYRLLFNLHTAELFRIWAITVHADGEQEVPIDTKNLCGGGDLDEVVTSRLDPAFEQTEHARSRHATRRMNNFTLTAHTKRRHCGA